MKTRWKILIVIGFAVLANYVVQHRPEPSAVGLPTDINNAYQYYNAAYFQNQLPNDVTITWDEPNPLYMASTDKMADGKFYIRLNQRFCRAERITHITLLHEMCHVATDLERDPMAKDHGPKWRACMLKLDLQGVWRRELIDGYGGN